MIRRTFILLLLTAACTAPPPAGPVPLQTVTVNAPFERTWNAVVDEFTNADLPIATIDKSSGVIAAPNLRILQTDAMNWASCPGFIMGPIASRGSFNVVVRPAGTGTSLRVTASFNSDKGTCDSKGVFERWMQYRIKTAAESAP